MKYLINAFWGFCMALADSVPGVSGGTIAFILGFYDKFINSLDSLFYGDFDEKKRAFWFLLKLGSGWIVGLCLATFILRFCYIFIPFNYKRRKGLFKK